MNVEPRTTEPGLWVNPRWRAGDPGLFAVVIGVSRYRHLSGGEAPAEITYGLGQLRVSALTAYEVFRWLAERYYVADCPVAMCWLLLAPTEQEIAYRREIADHAAAPTFGNCKDAIESWYAAMKELPSAAAKQSRSFFFFSGHGLEIYQEQQILLPHDYLRPRARNCDEAISTQNLKFGLASLPVARQFFFLDACRNDHRELRSKANSGQSILPVERPELVNSNLVAPLFYATASGQQAFQQPEPKKGLSLFGTALLDGFCGKPDMQLTVCGDLCSVNLYPLQGFVEERVVELLKAAGAEVMQPVKLSGIVRNEAITYLKREAATRSVSAVPLAPPTTVPAPTARSRGARVVASLKQAFAAGKEFARLGGGVFRGGGLLHGDSLHETFGSEHVAEMWLDRLRLFALSTWEAVDGGAVELHDVDWLPQTRAYRVEFNVTGSRDPLGHWLQLEDTSDVRHACVLPADESGCPRYQIEFDFAFDQGQGRQITRLEACLSPNNDGLLGVGADIWWRYRTADLGEAVRAIEEHRLERALRDKVESPLAATVAALVLLRAGRLDLLRDWVRNVADCFPEWTDAPALWAEQCLRGGASQEGAVHEAARYLLKLNERGLPHTSEGLAYATSVADRLALLASRLAPETQTAVARLQSRLTRALAYFRPAGLFTCYSGFGQDVSPQALLGLALIPLP